MKRSCRSRLPRRGALGFLLLALAAAGAGQALAAQGTAAAQVAAGAQRAFLVRGAASVRGLPFFSANALAALVGAYSLGGAAGATAPGGAAAPAQGVAPPEPELLVWYTREALVLGGSWKQAASYGGAAFALERPQGPVIVMKAAAYYLFFDLPQAAAERDRRAFIRAFDRKFLAFFENARSDAELSFPAYVDY
jgi:hypothetical protein